KTIPQFSERERCFVIRDSDSISITMRHALKVIDDRPIQVFVAKLAEHPMGWAVPVQRARTVLKPLQPLEFSGFCVSGPRSTSHHIPHGTTERVTLNSGD